MDGLIAKTPRQLRRPSRDARTPTLTRRAGLFRLADALQAEVHYLLLLEREWQSIEDNIMGFLRLLGSVLFRSHPFPNHHELFNFILSSFGFWLTSGPPLPRRYRGHPTQTTQTRLALWRGDHPLLSDLGEDSPPRRDRSSPHPPPFPFHLTVYDSL